MAAMIDQQTRDEKWSAVRSVLTDLYRAVDRLEALFPGRKFTPDGHLMGSIGEALAARMFDLRLLRASTPTHDASTIDGQVLVQIKITQGKQGVALTAEPDHLLVLLLRRDLSVEVVYNGRGHGPWSQAGKAQRNGQRGIALGKLRAVDGGVPDAERLPLQNKVDLRR